MGEHFFLSNHVSVKEILFRIYKELFQLHKKKTNSFKKAKEGFPGGAVVENLPANAGDTGSNPGLGRSHMPWSN